MNDDLKAVLERNGEEPLYLQLRRVIQQLAQQADPGEVLFTDEELAQRFGVNRLTVRHAVEALVAQGLLSRVRGVGTFVNETSVRSRFRSVERFFSEWSAQVNHIDVELLAFERRPCPGRYAEWLHIDPGAEVHYVQRRRWVDDEPMAVDNRYTRLEYAHVIKRIDVVVRPLFETISARLGVEVVDGYNELVAIPAGSYARLLQLTEDAPVLRRRLVLYAEDRKPVLAGSTHYRGDRFIYSFGGERGGDLRFDQQG